MEYKFKRSLRAVVTHPGNTEEQAGKQAFKDNGDVR